MEGLRTDGKLLCSDKKGKNDLVKEPFVCGNFY